MKMSDDAPAWKLFATLQTETDPRSIDRSLAREEALDAVLGEIASDPSKDKGLLRKRFSSLCRNRLSKRRNRRTLDRRRFRSTHRRCGADFGSILLMAPGRSVFDELSYSELINLVRTVLRKDELALLLEIADTVGYKDVAHDHAMTVSGLKSKIFRIREKVRSSRISTALRHGLRR
jgi:hypothetical protein